MRPSSLNPDPIDLIILFIGMQSEVMLSEAARSGMAPDGAKRRLKAPRGGPLRGLQQAPSGPNKFASKSAQQHEANQIGLSSADSS